MKGVGIFFKHRMYYFHHMFACMLTKNIFRTKFFSKGIIPFMTELTQIRFRSVSAQHTVSTKESCSSSNRVGIVLQI